MIGILYYARFLIFRKAFHKIFLQVVPQSAAHIHIS